MPIAARVAVLTFVLGWTLTASAQEHHAPDHTPSKAAAQAAARPVADATRDAGKHVPPAVAGSAEPTKPPAAAQGAPERASSGHVAPQHAGPERATPAKPAPAEPHGESTSAAAADKTPARPTPRPASNKELDVVMDRISRRISQFSGEGGRKAVAPPEEATSRSAVAPRVAAKKPPADRVHITWMPTVVWPGALLGEPTAAAGVGVAATDDGAVHLKWNSVQQ